MKTFVSTLVLLPLLLFVSLPLAFGTPAGADVVIASISSGKPSTTIPFEFSNWGHILVSARIDGKGPFVFVLDTGAERNCLDDSVVKALGLRTRGKSHVRGFGAKKLHTTQTDEATIQIGDASLAKQKFMALDFSGMQGFLNKTVVGCLGANVFKNFVVRIDYGQKTLNLSLPSTFTYQGDGIIIPLGFNKATCPHIDGQIDGITGTFNLDTGAGDSLILYYPFVEKNHLREKFGTQLHADKGGGLGGETHIFTTPPMRLEFGGIVATGPAELSTDRDGQEGVKAEAGTIGEAILRKLTVTFDYSRKRIIFEAPSQPTVAAPKPESV